MNSSESLRRLNNIVSSNAQRIGDVLPKRMIVVVKNSLTPLDPEILKFDKKQWKVARFIMIQEIINRPNEDDRFEFWEAVNEHGVYDFDVHHALIDKRKNRKHKGKEINRVAMHQLCERHGVDKSMANIFLNEIKLSTDDVNKKFRDSAKILGLMD